MMPVTLKVMVDPAGAYLTASRKVQLAALQAVSSPSVSVLTTMLPPCARAWLKANKTVSRIRHKPEIDSKFLLMFFI
ncbi:MAG TPA: hypothetical protein VF692_09190 [Pyrinomonadaceae bacterium]